MWKKLFRDASKMVANDVSKAYANETKKRIIQDKEQRLVEEHRLQLLADYKRDYERQKEVKEIDVRLKYLIETNNLCNQCLEVLKAPFESFHIINLVLTELDELKLETLNILDSDDFESEYFSDLLNNTVEAFTTLSIIMLGESDGECSGVINAIISFVEDDNQNTEDLEELYEMLNEKMDLVYSIKEQIRDVFTESKKGQITSYYAYGETGEIDFGSYTVEGLDT